MIRFAMILLMAGMALILGCSSADETAEHELSWLFVQSADHITLADGVLTLEGISPSTLSFTDRPDRIAAHELTSDFVTYWAEGNGPDSFAGDPPNAVAAVVTKGVEDDVVLTLTNPRLDGETLQYDVTVIDGNDTLVGGPGSLFIDTVGKPATPHSKAGHERRKHRQKKRAVTH